MMSIVHPFVKKGKGNSVREPDISIHWPGGRATLWRNGGAKTLCTMAVYEDLQIRQSGGHDPEDKTWTAGLEQQPSDLAKALVDMAAKALAAEGQDDE